MGLRLAPAGLLASFCLTALLLFADRGIIACNSVNGEIQAEFDIDLARDGLLVAAMVGGLMLSAPAAAQLSRHCPALRLVGAGLSLWVLGAAGCALAPSFPALLAARLAVGAAVGPFIALASPLIDDQAPRHRKSLWLASLFLCIPSGFAAGYIIGGVVGAALGWRAAFALEAVAMVPLAALTLLAAPVELHSGKPEGESAAGAAGRKSPSAALAADCRALLRSPVALLTILALSVYNGALGCYSFFGPKAAREVFDLPSQKADLLFGAVTVLTGVLGTLCGGLALDAMGPSVRSALLICTAGVGAACTLIMAGFTLAQTLGWFAPAFAAGEFAMFLLAAPVNAALLWSVPPGLRPFTLSACEFAQHALGDIPSPPALGWLQGRIKNWRVSMSVATALLAASAALFLAALCKSHGAASYRDVAEVEGEALAEDGDGAATQGAGGGAAAAAAEAGAEGLQEPLLQQEQGGS